MLFSLVFFITSLLAGLAILEFIQLNTSAPLKTLLGIITGTVLNTLAVFIASLIFGLNVVIIIGVIFLTFLPSLIFLVRRGELSFPLGRVNLKKNLLATCGFLIIVLYVILIFAKSIYVSQSGAVAGNRLVWTDWPVHLAIISSFVHGDNFPPQNPLYTNQIISYPFFADFLSAIFQVLGADLKTSLVLPGVILGLTSMGLLYYLGLFLTGKREISVIGLFVGIFWGGLGFIYFLGDLIRSSNFWGTLTFPPHEYTFYHEKNLWFFSFLYSELLPQRSFLFGLPMFLAALILLFLGLTHSKKTYLLLSGCLIAILPFFHMHSYVSFLLLFIVFTSPFLLTIVRREGIREASRRLKSILIYFVLPVAGFGLIQLPFFLSINLNQLIGFHWGWMKGNENFFLFWFKNTGFFWPLWLLAFIKVKTRPLASHVFLASIVLFILPNIFRFAPWSYDNLKIMTYWYLISSFFVAMALIYIYKRSYLGKILAIVLFLSLILSGVIEVGRIFNTKMTKIPIWNYQDFELANSVIEKTEPQSVILAAAVHDHPIAGIAGRRLILGFPGNAWAWGLADWQQRESDLHMIFKGDPIYTPYLLKKYKVDYVLISPRERYFEPNLNEQYFTQNFAFIDGGVDYKLYQVR